MQCKLDDDGAARLGSAQDEPSLGKPSTDRYADNERLRTIVEELRLEFDDTQEALRSSEETLRLALQGADMGTWQWDTAADELSGSERAWSILGVSASVLSYEAFLASVERSDRSMVAKAMAAALTSKSDVRLEFRLALPDRSSKWIAWTGRAFEAEPGWGGRMLGTVKDITERKRMMEVLNESGKMEAIGRLAGGVAHDFNNMLGPILGYADLLAKLLEDPEMQKFAEAILQAAHRAADLTSRLLGFARKGKHSMEPVNLHETIEDVVNLLEHSIDRSITVKQDLAAPTSVVLGDKTQLYNVLLNLAVNARDAMPNGGTLSFATRLVEYDPEVWRELGWELTPGQYLEVSVTDSGVGMAPETARRVFEPFFTTKPQGTGMGLAAAYGTLRSHGGAISLKTELGRGSSLTALLPLAQRKPAAADDVAPATSVETSPASVLVIDDDEGVRSVMADMLRVAGYRVQACKNGVEATALLQESSSRFDVAIVEMGSPGTSGVDTLAELRRINPKLAVLLSSGNGLRGDGQAVLEHGALGVVHKPCSATELARQVQEALDLNAKRRR